MPAQTLFILIAERTLQLTYHRRIACARLSKRPQRFDDHRNVGIGLRETWRAMAQLVPLCSGSTAARATRRIEYRASRYLSAQSELVRGLRSAWKHRVSAAPGDRSRHRFKLGRQGAKDGMELGNSKHSAAGARDFTFVHKPLEGDVECWAGRPETSFCQEILSGEHRAGSPLGDLRTQNSHCAAASGRLLCHCKKTAASFLHLSIKGLRTYYVRKTRRLSYNPNPPIKFLLL